MWLPISQELLYAKETFVDQQDWVFVHNLKTSPVVQCFDTQGNKVEPQFTRLRDNNTVLLHFANAMSGIAVAVAGNPFGTPQADYTYTTDFTDVSQVTVVHGLGYNPEVSIWVKTDTGGMALVAPVINWIDNNSFSFQLNSPRSGTVYCV